MSGRSTGMATPVRQRWALLAAVGGAAVTMVDAYLLERKKGFFTGGFLSIDHLDSWSDRLAFLTISWLADAAFVGAGAALALWAFRRLRLPSRWAWIGALSLGIAPLAIADVVRFELDKYLGDAFDLSLMFDLVGGDPGEFIAVGWPHLRTPLLVLAAGLVAVMALVWVLRRRLGASLSDAVFAARVGWTLPLALLLLTAFVASAARVASPVLDDALRRKASVDWPGRLVDMLTDLDRDGYGLLGRPADPAPWDARVYPYALDRPGNAVDEDGVAGDMPAGLPPYEEPDAGPGRWTSRRHIVLIMLESVRADAVGATWESRPVTPVLDALAKGGIRAKDAWSHNGYTVQSRHHVFSGSLANLRGGTTLIDDFKANGYEVAYVSGQDDRFGSAALNSGLDRADYTYTARDEPARRYSTFSTPGSLAVPFTVVEEKVTAFLRGRDDRRPLFLYVNLHDTHFPYAHRGVTAMLNRVRLRQEDIAPDRRAELWAMYLNTLANVDASIGRLLDEARRTLHGDIGVVVLSDHGESLYDEGFLGHGYALNEVQTRIPLIASNLPLVIDEPWGQASLRDGLRAALRDDSGGAARPQLRRHASPGLFQYLGGFNRPRQVGWRYGGDRGRVLYDVRNRQVSLVEGQLRRESQLADGERDKLHQLVLLWERMRMAVANRRSADSPADAS